MSVSDSEMYEQGSKACIQYSQLTLDTRRFGQQTLLAYLVGLCIALTKQDAWSPSYIPFVLGIGGLVLIAFAAGLWLLNYHYSASFQVIRDNSLIQLENSDSGITGPWTAHKAERENKWFWTYLAWHAPFLVMIDVGLASLFLSIHYKTGGWDQFWIFGAVVIIEFASVAWRSHSWKSRSMA
ncbi:MAG: hypothetical protein K0U98_00865 [Deltaproteobacteria bacterium]|nr:hypothetical protein [Deltaproteobacteria bacterium]